MYEIRDNKLVDCSCISFCVMHEISEYLEHSSFLPSYSLQYGLLNGALDCLDDRTINTLHLKLRDKIRDESTVWYDKDTEEGWLNVYYRVKQMINDRPKPF